MAFSAVGSLGLNASGTANQSTISLTTTSFDAVAGSLILVAVAVDNALGTDGDNGDVVGLLDTAGNTYFKAKEFTNGQGAAQGGATISLWYSVADVTLPIGGVITASFNNTTTSDAAVISAYNYTLAAGNTVMLDGAGAAQADDAFADSTSPYVYPSLNYTTTAGTRLRVRASAREYPSSVAVATSGWNGFTAGGTSGGSNASNMMIFAESKVSTSTSDASAPTATAAIASSDFASVHVAFIEVLGASAAEVGIAWDSSDTTGAFGAPTTETGSATDSVDATGSFAHSVSETGAAADSLTPNPVNTRNGLLGFGAVAAAGVAAVNPRGSFSASTTETATSGDSAFLGSNELADEGVETDDTIDAWLDGDPPAPSIPGAPVPTKPWTKSGSGGSGVSITGTAIPVSVGDLIIVHYASYGTGFPTVNFTATFSAGGAATAFTTTATRTNNAGYTVGWAVVTAAGNLTAVASSNSPSTTAQIAALVTVFGGPFRTSPVDAIPTPAQDLTPAFTTPLTATLAQSDELVIGVMAATPGLGALTATTLIGNVSSGTKTGSVSAHMCYKTVASTAQTQTSFGYKSNAATDLLGTITFRLGLPTTTNRGRFFAFF